MFKKLPPMGRSEFIILMAALSALNALAIGMLLPAFGDIRASFMLAENDTRLPQIVFVYFMGMALGLPIFGPLADDIGRKKTLYIGVVIYIIASFAAVFSGRIEMLLAARFIQGFGTAPMRILSISIVRDRYQGRAMAEIMSMVMIVFMLVPVISPSFGQLIILIFPWQIMFIICVLAALTIGIWAAWRLPETLEPQNRRPLNLQNIINSITFTLTDRLALNYTLVLTCIFGAFAFYLGNIEAILNKIYHIQGFTFTLSFSFMSCFMAVGNFINSRYVRRLGLRKLSQTALLSFISISLLLLIISMVYKGFPPFIIFIFLFAFLLLSTSLIFANGNAMAMENMGKIAGSSASVIGFLSTMGASVFAGIISQFYLLYNNITAVAFAFLICGLGALFFMLIAEKFKIFSK